jgi:hypothetical protein
MPYIDEQALNAALLRRSAIAGIQSDLNISSDRNYDLAFEYPPTEMLDHGVYQKLFDRHPMATKVVTLLPDEAWQDEPLVYDQDKPEESPFEKAVKDFNLDYELWSRLHALDVLSGIGHYGCMLIGIDDDKSLQEPVEEVVNQDQEDDGIKQGDYGITFLRSFAEGHCQIQTYNQDAQSPRYGLPELYSLTFVDHENRQSTTESVHWSRIIHVADNALYGDVIGVPRMRPVINTLFDIRKVLGSSAEMYWLGAFPGMSVEIDEKPGTTVDIEAIKEQLYQYTQGLKRYVGLVNARVNTMSQTIVDPRNQIEQYIEQICIYLNCPIRVFKGAESAHLAADQDQRVWNNRIMRRQRMHLTPRIILPTINRLVTLGAIPQPVNNPNVEWPDLNGDTPEKKAEYSKVITDAMAAYLSNNLQQLITIEDYLVKVWNFSTDEVDSIVKKSEDETLKGLEDDESQYQPPAQFTPQQNRRNKHAKRGDTIKHTHTSRPR